MLDAVRTSIDQMRRAHATETDPSGPIPRIAARRRRRLDSHGSNVAVRFYPAERQALDNLTTELGISLSALISEALISANL